MKRSAPISVLVCLVAALFLLDKSGPFERLVSNLAEWGWGDDPQLTEFPVSAPEVNFPAFTIPDGVEVPPLPSEQSTPPSPESSTTAPPEGTQVVQLSQVDPASPGLVPIADNQKAQAVALIEQVRTAGRGPKTGYEREAFGQSWTDDNPDGLFGHNGCDTRNDILERDIDGETFRPNTDNCVVLSGTMSPEPYTGRPLHWSREGGGIDIDHVVALSAAWQMGAAHWDNETRTAFANDPLNLVAADSAANRQKGDSTPASWLPPSKTIRCAYVTRYAAVSIRYDLPVTAADKELMLRQCA